MLDPADLGIIADDLTGACDVAACFLAGGGAVEVSLAPEGPFADGPGLQVTNTQSRLADPGTARQVLRLVGTRLAGKRVVFKKMDTGLRGPLGAELEGLMEGLRDSGGLWSCVVAPAAPSIGRITRDGVQYDRGVPVDQGALAQDPESPPRSAHIRTVIGLTGRVDFQVGDAGGPEDLQRIVDARLGEGRTVLAGSLGLAEALARRLHPARCGRPARPPAARRPLLVCGSRHPLSSRQVEQARGAGLRIVSFDPARRHFGEDVAPTPEEGIVVRILPDAVPAEAASPGGILAAFIDALDQRWERLAPDGLGIVGGETAYHLLRRLGAERLRVGRRQAEVIAGAQIAGGRMDGCPMVCKGGSVGPEDAVLQMLSLLKAHPRGQE
ncbi:MAG: four-carbon acid sugar kinase family protein [Gemmatimonadota bacterium]